jgi:hypothetical protein
MLTCKLCGNLRGGSGSEYTDQGFRSFGVARATAALITTLHCGAARAGDQFKARAFSSLNPTVLWRLAENISLGILTLYARGRNLRQGGLRCYSKI